MRVVLEVPDELCTIARVFDVSNCLHRSLTEEEMSDRLNGLDAEYDRNVEYGFLSDPNETREHYKQRAIEHLNRCNSGPPFFEVGLVL